MEATNKAVLTLEEIRKIAPKFKGKPENFDPTKVGKTSRSAPQAGSAQPRVARSLAPKSKAPSLREPPSCESITQLAKERASQHEKRLSEGKVTAQKNCFACLLREREDLPMFGPELCSCSVALPRLGGVEELIPREQPLDLESRADTLSAQLNLLAGNRDMAETVALRPNGSSSQSEHVVFLAPPGSGKTTAQRYLMKRGIITLDSSHVAAPTPGEVAKMLTVTSVFTDDKELISKDMTVVRFVPNKRGLRAGLRRRNKVVTEKTFGDYLRDTFTNKKTYTVFINEHSVAQWFQKQLEGRAQARAQSLRTPVTKSEKPWLMRLLGCVFPPRTAQSSSDLTSASEVTREEPTVQSNDQAANVIREVLPSTSKIDWAAEVEGLN